MPPEKKTLSKQQEANRGRGGLKGAGPGRKKGLPNKATREIRSLAQLHGTACIEGLAKLMNHRNAGVKLAAIKEMLEWGYTKPKEPGQALIPTGGIKIIVQAYTPPAALPGPLIDITSKSNGHGGNGHSDPTAE